MTWDTQATGRVKDLSTDYARYVPCSNLEHCQEQSRKALVSKYTWVYFVGLSTRSTNVDLKCLALFQTLNYAYECVRCCFWYKCRRLLFVVFPFHSCIFVVVKRLFTLKREIKNTMLGCWTGKNWDKKTQRKQQCFFICLCMAIEQRKTHIHTLNYN